VKLPALKFEPLSLDHQGAYLRLLKQRSASDYSFVNLFGWTQAYGLELAFNGELALIRDKSGCYWAPVGDWTAIDWRGLLEPGDCFTRVPAELVAVWRCQGLAFTAEPAREHFDYLYNVSDLIELKGNRYHKKKNLLSQFTKNYAYEYAPLTAALIPSLLDSQFSWCRYHDCESDESLEAEQDAIVRVLEHWDALKGVCGGAIVVDGEVAAFSVAEAYAPDSLIIHFEKGLPAYKGVYQAINQQFLSHNPGFTLVNREQDLGDEGLRKAKLSYQPCGFVEKFTVSFTG
jgi:hypothetical protein